MVRFISKGTQGNRGSLTNAGGKTHGREHNLRDKGTRGCIALSPFLMAEY